jgi:hypothetical protein
MCVVSSNSVKNRINDFYAKGGMYAETGGKPNMQCSKHIYHSVFKSSQLFQNTSLLVDILQPSIMHKNIFIEETHNVERWSIIFTVDP